MATTPSIAAEFSASAVDPTLQSSIDTLAGSALPGIFGVDVLDLRTGRHFGANIDSSLPMMSDFKAEVAAAVLARVDQGTMSLSQQVVIEPADVVPGSAVPSIGARSHGKALRVSLRDLLVASVDQSDNTAVDVELRELGGARAVSDFLTSKGISGMQIRGGERDIAAVFDNNHGLLNDPEGEDDRAKAMRLSQGYSNFLADPPNQTTPMAAATFMAKLAQNRLLSPVSTRYLIGLLRAQISIKRLRLGLPKTVCLADKTGTGPTVDGRIAAYNDHGVLTFHDGHVVVIAAYLSNSSASEEEREKLFATLAREVSAALR